MPAISASSAATSIVSVNGEKIAKTRDLARVTEKPSRAWRIIIRRGGQQISAVFNG